MVKRLIGIVALGAGTLFLGAVPAFAAHTITPTAVTAPAAEPTYVEWSAPTTRLGLCPDLLYVGEQGVEVCRVVAT